MLGEILFEERGRTSGVRVISSDANETTLEVSLQTEGRILGVEQRSMWTYLSRTRSDGSIYGEGKGIMTTKDGDVIRMEGVGAAPGMSGDGSIRYRCGLHFQTNSQKFSKLNGVLGVAEYNVAADGTTVATVWEWK